jgi:hypothetical protein
MDSPLFSSSQQETKVLILYVNIKQHYTFYQFNFHKYEKTLVYAREICMLYHSMIDL